jgi:hypothetical protein
VEDQSHVIRCPAYSDIRQGLDMEEDKDVVQYFRRVMNEEEKMKDGFSWSLKDCTTLLP